MLELCAVSGSPRLDFGDDHEATLDSDSRRVDLVFSKEIDQVLESDRCRVSPVTIVDPNKRFVLPVSTFLWGQYVELACIQCARHMWSFFWFGVSLTAPAEGSLARLHNKTFVLEVVRDQVATRLFVPLRPIQKLLRCNGMLSVALATGDGEASL